MEQLLRSRSGFDHFDDDVADMSLSLLLVGGEFMYERDRISGVNIVGPIAADVAADHLRDMASPDIVWLRDADRMAHSILAALGDAIAARQCGLICETSLSAIDRIAAALPASVRVEWLVDADAAERMIAVAALRRPRAMRVGDVARDDALERIDQLQEEVARISRLLGDLAAQRGLSGVPMGYSAREEGNADYPSAVRSPIRPYAAGPRSFVPEDRMADRQRAKSVRRLLRQRRMREQYFPADLFADPAWDMLLDLYAARLEHQPVSVSSLCIAAAVPATTALRWIKTMTDAGLFLREADPHDGRRIFIALAEGAVDSIACYCEALED